MIHSATDCSLTVGGNMTTAPLTNIGPANAMMANGVAR